MFNKTFQAPKPDPRETPPIRPLESDADVSIHQFYFSNLDQQRNLSSHEQYLSELTLFWTLNFPLQAVLTRLCGCDKLLQSLSVELAQLQMDKVSSYPRKLQYEFKYNQHYTQLNPFYESTLKLSVC